MLEIRGGLDLLQEPHGAEHCSEFGRPELQRDLALVRDVLGEVHRRRTDSTELALNAEATGERCVQSSDRVGGQERRSALENRQCYCETEAGACRLRGYRHAQ